MGPSGEDVRSPLTGTTRTRVVETIRVGDIARQYSHEHGVDVLPYFRGRGEVSIVECVETGYRFYHPLWAVGDGEFYAALQANAGDASYYRPWSYDHAFAARVIRPGDRVLDVGCGSGNFLKAIRSTTPHVRGLEFNKRALEECAQVGIEASSETLEAHAALHPETYDVVCLFQVLEHIPEAGRFLDAALATLKKGGRLVVGVPNNEPYYQRFTKRATLNMPPHHMGLWNRESLQALEKLYPVALRDVGYDAEDRWVADAYHRAKSWMRVHSSRRHHTLAEKARVAVALPLAAVPSLAKRLTSGIHGEHIVALFTKNDAA